MLIFQIFFVSSKHCETLMPLFKLLFVLSLIFVLSACASLSKEECTQGNWFDIGYSDGKSGQRITQLSDHREACLEYHVSPDATAYKQGREQGLLRYCTAENALQEGLSGDSYYGVCPVNLEPAFIKKYDQGHSIYKLQEKIEQHNSRISSINYNLDSDKRRAKLSAKEIKKLERELIKLEVKVEEKQKRLYYMKGQADIPM